MDQNQTAQFRKLKAEIAGDLVPDLIIQHLLDKNVLSNDERNSILESKSEEDQAKLLLDIIEARGMIAVCHLEEALRVDFEWVAKTVDEIMGIKEFRDSEAFSGPLQSDDEKKREMLKSTLLLGGVPSLPSNYVSRTEYASDAVELSQFLLTLERGQFIVVKGPGGCGKTSMAVEVLNDANLILKKFPDGVFWCRTGSPDSDELLQLMKVLCKKLESLKNINSGNSLQSNLKHWQETFRKLFSTSFENSLIVLDDVMKIDVIEAFTVGARVLVTTRDESVVKNLPVQDKKLISMLPGLSQEESLKLFSKYVGYPSEYLPDEAYEIHNECRGSPLVIALIGDLIGPKKSGRQAENWSYYLDKLAKRRYSKLATTEGNEFTGLMDSTAAQIDNLDDGLKKKFKQLVIFHEVGVASHGTRYKLGTFALIWVGSLNKKAKRRPKRPIGIDFGGMYDAEKNKEYYNKKNTKKLMLPLQVLMTYWNMESIEVSNLLDTFTVKSLGTTCNSDEALDFHTVYSIDVWLLEYLNVKENAEIVKGYHKVFLDNYFKKANYVYGDIQDDSYIFFNIGYHLSMSGQFDLFPKIYLDLRFVEAALKATSSVDLLKDYQRYSEFIATNEELFQKLDDFEAFVRLIGPTISTSELMNIKQLALREPEDSKVYEIARKMALDDENILYFEWINRPTFRGRNSATIIHQGIVETARFLSDMTKILTTNEEGLIKIWNVKSGEVLHRFTGHKARVKSLSVYHEGETFVSGSEDGTVKVWEVGSFVDESENGNKEQHKILKSASFRKPSPKSQPLPQMLTKQAELKDLSNQSHHFSEINSELVHCVDFSPSGLDVAASGESGRVKVFNIRERKFRLEIKGNDSPVLACRFSYDERVLATGNATGQILVYDSSTGIEVKRSSHHRGSILDLAFVPNSDKILSLSENDLILWGWEKDQGKLLTHFKPCKYSCMRVSNDGKTIAAGSKDNVITIWDIKEENQEKIVATLPGHGDLITTLDFSPDDNFLLSGSVDETIMIWSMEDIIDSSKFQRHPTGLGPPFDVKFLNGVSLMATVDSANSLMLLEDGVQKIKTSPKVRSITAIALSDHGDKIGYGCSDGSVLYYTTTTKTLSLVHPAKVNPAFTGRRSSDYGLPPLITKVKIGTWTQNELMKLFVISLSKQGELRIWNETLKFGKILVLDFFILSDELSDLRVLMIDREYTLSIVDMSNIEPKMEEPTRLEKKAESFCFDVCQSTSAIAAARFDGHVTIIDSNSKLTSSFQAGPSISVIRFTHDGEYVVTGHCPGAKAKIREPRRARCSGVRSNEDPCFMQIWDTKKCEQMYGSIGLHLKMLRDIQWSRDKYHLVVVGEKITWWSLTRIPKKVGTPVKVATRGAQTSLYFRRTSNRNSNAITFDSDAHDGVIGQTPSTPRTPKSDRKISTVSFPDALPNDPNLLQVFEICGRSASLVFASDDFKSFVTLDSAGYAYFLKEIHNKGTLPFLQTDL